MARLSVVVMLAMLVIAPWMCAFDPAHQDRAAANTPPGAQHWLGTDDYGRDLLSRFLFGARWSLGTGAGATLLALSVGWVMGGAAGLLGGWADQAIMLVAEWFLALPWLYLLVAVRAALPLSLPPRQSFLVILTLIALVNWARPARLVRGTVLSLSQRGYVEAARGFGVPSVRILTRHIFPGTLDLLRAQTLTLLPRFVLAEVTLSFLGLGVSEPHPSWGALILPLKQIYLLPEHWWKVAPVLLMLPIFVSLALAAREAEKNANLTR